MAANTKIGDVDTMISNEMLSRLLLTKGEPVTL